MQIRFLIFILCALHFTFPFLLQHQSYEFNNQELLLIEQGQHAQITVTNNYFISHWNSVISNAIGNHFFWYKCWSMLYGSLSLLAAAEMTLMFGGSFFAIALVFLVFIADTILKINYQFQPDAANLFFTMLALLSVLKIQLQKVYTWSYLFGLACLGLWLNGVENQVLVVILFVAILASTQYIILFNYHMLISLVLCVGFFVIWYLLAQVKFTWFFTEYSLNSVTKAKAFVLQQFVYIVAVCYLWVMGVLYIWLTKKGRLNYLYLFNACLLVLIVCFCSTIKTTQTLAFYIPVMGIGAYNFERLTKKRIPILRYVLISVTIYLAFIYMPFSIPIVSIDDCKELLQKRQIEQLGLLKWTDGTKHNYPEFYQDMVGKKEITEKVFDVYSRQPTANTKRMILYADDEGIASGLNYYGRFLGLPKAYCSSKAYRHWTNDTTTVERIIMVTAEHKKTDNPLVQPFKTELRCFEINNNHLKDSTLWIYLYENGSSTLNQICSNP